MTKPKRRPLAEAIGGDTPVKAAEKPVERSKAVEVAKAAPSGQRPSRANTQFVGGHFPPEVRKQLRMLAAEQDKTSQQLVAEGLNLMFQSYGKTACAPTGKD